MCEERDVLKRFDTPTVLKAGVQKDIWRNKVRNPTALDLPYISNQA